MSQTAMLHQITSDYPVICKGSRLCAVFRRIRYRTAGRRLTQADLKDNTNKMDNPDNYRLSFGGLPQLDRFLQRTDR